MVSSSVRWAILDSRVELSGWMTILYPVPGTALIINEKKEIADTYLVNQ